MSGGLRRLSALWQRNLAGGLGLGAALAVICATQLWPQWSAYRNTVIPERAVARGDSVTVDGQRWQVESVRHLGGTDHNLGPRPLPRGAVQDIVTIARSGEDPGQACVGVLTDGTRRWTAMTGALPAGPGATTLCSLPGSLQLTFEVPGDAVPSAVDITRPDGQIVIRLVL